MKADRTPMRMDDLRDPPAEFDSKFNRLMCWILIGNAVFWLVFGIGAGLALYWMSK